MNRIYLLLTFSVLTTSIYAQDTQELEAERALNENLKGEHPLIRLMETKNSSLKKELEGVHPRVYLTQSEIEALKIKAQTQKALWSTALSRVRALAEEPTPAPAQARRVQNPVGLGIPEAALAYKITGEGKYLKAAKKYMDAAVSYEIWGYAYNKPDVDLAAGHLLYGLGWGYDLLYHDLSDEERQKYKTKLIRQARLLYEFYKPHEGKTYAYSQNHTFIPMSGLAVTAYALAGETSEAKNWAALPRAIFEGVLATYSKDGFYYEGVEYWIFSTPWLLHYMDVHFHATGENLYNTVPGFKQMHKYIAHANLPGAETHFDYGDTYTGNLTRSKKSEDYFRERIDGQFVTSYNVFYQFASQFQNGEAQGVANWLKSKGQLSAEEMWSFIWYDPSIEPIPIEKQQPWHYFSDHDVVFWRSSWKDNATAFSFKCGPSEGHAALQKQKEFPEWRLSSGHAHPDAASFIIWANGKYLTGDSGYEGLAMTLSHNTLVFDGKGQNHEGEGHDVFYGIPYERINKIKLLDVSIDATQLTLVADATAAYEPEVGVTKFLRKFEFKAPNSFVITDDVETLQPKTVTSYLHADNSIVALEEYRFAFESPGTSLEVEIVTPTDINTSIEKNLLTAPGDPGSVDKGGEEERGKKLAISTKKKVSNVTFVVKLSIKDDN